MTTEQALQRLEQHTGANKWDLIYNWVKQGELRTKAFRGLIEALTVEVLPERKTESEVQDKYDENRKLMLEDRAAALEKKLSVATVAKKRK